MDQNGIVSVGMFLLPVLTEVTSTCRTSTFAILGWLKTFGRSTGCKVSRMPHQRSDL